MEIFVRVVECNGFSAAARELALSTPTVSRSIDALEAELGVALLQRTTRRVRATQAGRAFYLRCADIVAAAHAAVRELEDSQARLAGTLRIFTPTAFGRIYLGPVLAAFLARFPELQLDLVYGDRPVDLLAEHIDAAIMLTPLVDSSLRVIKLGEVRRILCAAPAYLSAHGEPTHPRELTRHACLVFSGPGPVSTWRLEGPGEAVSVKVKPAVQANSADALLQLLLEGAGLGLPPMLGIREALAQGKLRHVLPDWSGEPMPIQLVYPPHAQKDRRVRAFASFLVESFRHEPPWHEPSRPTARSRSPG